MARHGTYERLEPPGVKVARYYCKRGHTSFSLLPDFLASRLSSTLQEVEQVVAAVEASSTVEAVAKRLRPDVGRLGARRWVYRRMRLVGAALRALIGLLPTLLAGVQPTLDAFRVALGRPAVLPALREMGDEHLPGLPPPVGFGPWPRTRRALRLRLQHRTGPDPPSEMS